MGWGTCGDMPVWVGAGTGSAMLTNPFEPVCQCAMVPLAGHAPLFPGENDIDQIFRVMQVLGTPSSVEWPVSAVFCRIPHRGQPAPRNRAFPHVCPRPLHAHPSLRRAACFTAAAPAAARRSFASHAHLAFHAVAVPIARVRGVCPPPPVQSVEDLPDFNKITFPTLPALPLRCVLPDASSAALSLLERFLRYNPDTRLSAGEVRSTP